MVHVVYFAVLIVNFPFTVVKLLILNLSAIYPGCVQLVCTCSKCNCNLESAIKFHFDLLLVV